MDLSAMKVFNCSQLGKLKKKQKTKNKNIQYSSHAIAMKFIGLKPWSKINTFMHEKLRYFLKREIWGNFLKTRYFANNFLRDYNWQN